MQEKQLPASPEAAPRPAEENSESRDQDFSIDLSAPDALERLDALAAKLEASGAPDMSRARQASGDAPRGDEAADDHDEGEPEDPTLVTEIPEVMRHGVREESPMRTGPLTFAEEIPPTLEDLRIKLQEWVEAGYDKRELDQMIDTYLENAVHFDGLSTEEAAALKKQLMDPRPGK